jgi:hypothetical protein
VFKTAGILDVFQGFDKQKLGGKDSPDADGDLFRDSRGSASADLAV